MTTKVPAGFKGGAKTPGKSFDVVHLEGGEGIFRVRELGEEVKAGWGPWRGREVAGSSTTGIRGEGGEFTQWVVGRAVCLRTEQRKR